MTVMACWEAKRHAYRSWESTTMCNLGSPTARTLGVCTFGRACLRH